MDHLVLIDGHHLMHRAYWAIPRTLKTRSGEQTNVSFGMASMLIAILQSEHPDAVVLCFDEAGDTFRHEEHTEYKEGRAETPDDFYEQIPRVMEVVDALGLKRVSQQKYEADDFLCTYAKAGEDVGSRVTIVTGDKDALQLASEKVRVAIPHKGYHQAEYLGPKEIEDKYGIRPDQVCSFKGLCGDSSDNLPGVKGIGPKTAASLLQQFGTLEEVYENLTDVKPTVREKLERDRESAFFCERMAELVCDIPLPYTLDEIALREVDPEPALTMFSELEFTLLSKRLLSLLATDYGGAHFRSPESVTVPDFSGAVTPHTQASLF